MIALYCNTLQSVLFMNKFKIWVQIKINLVTEYQIGSILWSLYNPSDHSGPSIKGHMS